jgi:hypothetical protein
MAYITVQDVRNEGVAITDYDDAKVTDRIALAQSFIERVLGCFYEKRDSFVLTLDGTGHDLLWLPVPPISTTAITEILLDDVAVVSTDYRVIMPSFPDGRKNPKLKMISGWWTKGGANVQITGSFGYVDTTLVEGTPVYSTPAEAKRLCMLITLWALPQLNDAEARRSARIVEESLGSYRYRLSEGDPGMFGDPEIIALFGMLKLPKIATAG